MGALGFGFALLTVLLTLHGGNGSENQTTQLEMGPEWELEEIFAHVMSQVVGTSHQIVLNEAGNHTNALPLSVENVFSMSHTRVDTADDDEEQPATAQTSLLMAETTAGPRPLIRARRSITPVTSASTNLVVRMPNGKRLPLMAQWTDTVEQVKVKVHDAEGTPRIQQRLFYAGRELADGSTLASSNIPLNATLQVILKPGSSSSDTQAYYPDMREFDPKWNTDFRALPADTQAFYRGGRIYHRPIGSLRYGIKAWDKYGDNAWLGTTGAAGTEWWVCYHGTAQANLRSIVQQGLLKSKMRNGGIYCAQDPNVSLTGYATPFQYKGKNYQAVFQARVNPATAQVYNWGGWGADGGNVYVVQRDEDIHLYGLCIYPNMGIYG